MSVAAPPGSVRRGLFSVSDRTGIVEFGRGLASLGIELVATSGTRKALEDGGVHARPAEDLTGIADWFHGRLKTLHPGLLGGILAPRNPAGLAELEQRALVLIDLVAVNFYPFAPRAVRAPAPTELAESIDIGGVTLARAAAKNHDAVTVVTDPSQYDGVLAELRSRRGVVSAETRLRLATWAFRRCAEYDRLIATGIDVADDSPFPQEVVFRREPITLRYGENPHQRAAAYRLVDPPRPVLAGDAFALLKGDSLSFTNLLDLSTALAIVGEFPTATAAVVKHATPCGVASGETIRDALAKAIATDPVARYGCAIAVNRPLGDEDPAALHGVFVDLLAASEFSPGALTALSRRPKVKVVRTSAPDRTVPRWEAHSALGRLLLQDEDHRDLAPGECRLVTSHSATPVELASLGFAWRVVRHAKSNAIVLAQASSTVGIGCGQPTRVKAVELAVEVAGDRAKGSVLASDAFFPFPDGVEVAGRAGVAAILQPGGSVRDPEVIQAAEKFGIAMYFTGWRVFRH